MSQDNNESIIIIGGSNAGVSAATRIRRLNEKANITIIEQSSFIGSNQAALPYFISGAVTSVETIIADIEPTLQNVYDIDLLKNCQVTRIDRKNHKLYIYNHVNMQDFEMEYDKLVVATGFEYDVTEDSTISSMNNFFTLKSLEDVIKIRHFIDTSAVRDIAIIGSNCISVKTAAALIEQGFNVTLIDKKPVLLEEFDDDFNSILKKEITKADCTLYLNTDVRKYTKNADNYITLVQADGLELKVDMVLYFDNIRPNTRLAQSCGCNVGSNNGLCVNADFRTNDDSIWAGGSAVELPDFITKDMTTKFSVSQSSFHGRQIGSNICGTNTTESHNVMNYFFKLKSFAVGIAGINESQAKKSGYDYIIAEVFTGDHERFIPNAHQIHLKLIVDRKSRRILGGQVSGSSDSVERKMDIILSAIYGGMTVDMLTNMNFSYNPQMNLVADPVNTVAMIAQNIIDGISNPVYSKNLTLSDNICLLDIRTKNEHDRSRVINSLWIPLDELRDRLKEIPKDKKIYVYGHVGIRSYIAERILKGSGFKHVYNIVGGISSIKINENID